MMNKDEMAKRAAKLIREKGYRKTIQHPERTFYITDNNGNSKKFTSDKSNGVTTYNIDDVRLIIEACIEVALEAIKEGDSIAIPKVGTIYPAYRVPHVLKKLGETELTRIPGHYIPKFTPSKNLKELIKSYDTKLHLEGNHPDDLELARMAAEESDE